MVWSAWQGLRWHGFCDRHEYAGGEVVNVAGVCGAVVQGRWQRLAALAGQLTLCFKVLDASHAELATETRPVRRARWRVLGGAEGCSMRAGGGR